MTERISAAIIALIAVAILWLATRALRARYARAVTPAIVMLTIMSVVAAFIAGRTAAAPIVTDGLLAFAFALSVLEICRQAGAGRRG